MGPGMLPKEPALKPVPRQIQACSGLHSAGNGLLAIEGKNPCGLITLRIVLRKRSSNAIPTL